MGDPDALPTGGIIYAPLDEPTGGHSPYKTSRFTREHVVLVPIQRLRDVERDLAAAVARIRRLEADLEKALVKQIKAGG